MNPFDPQGSLLMARERMDQRERSAALQRLIHCCRSVFDGRIDPRRLRSAGRVRSTRGL